MKLTARAIDAALAKDRTYVLWDHDLGGFGVRIWPGGAKTFVLKTRVGQGRSAKQSWVTIGRVGPLRLEDARRQALQIIAGAAKGVDPKPAKPLVPEVPRGPETVGELCEHWLLKGSLRSRQRGKLAGKLRDPKNIAIDQGRINAHIIPLLGKVKLSELTRARIEGFRDAVARGDTRQETKTKARGLRRVTGGEGAASRTLRLLSSILSFGVREGFLPSNPALGVEKTPDRCLERFLSTDEMRTLGEVLLQAEASPVPKSAIAIIRMLALSGARKGEIEKLKWSEVDLQTGFLRLSASKTGAKLIPISGPMRGILEVQATRRINDWVFPDTNNVAYFVGTPKVWLKVRAMAALDDVRLHDLRHSAASFGLAGGLGLEVIGKLLGHQDIKTTRRYAHLSDGYMKAAAESMAGGIAELLQVKTIK
jgi:integrase